MGFQYDRLNFEYFRPLTDDDDDQSQSVDRSRSPSQERQTLSEEQRAKLREVEVRLCSNVRLL